MPTLKQYCRVRKNKRRCCPHCKSKKGFELTYGITGSGFLVFDFNGKILDSEHNSYNNDDRYVSCINCKKDISRDEVQTDTN